jgi:subtilisin family serine protease
MRRRRLALGCREGGLLALVLCLVPAGLHAGPGELILRLRDPRLLDGAPPAAGRPDPRVLALLDDLAAAAPELAPLRGAEATRILAPGRAAHAAAARARGGDADRARAALAAEPLERTLLLRLSGTDAKLDLAPIAAALLRLPEVELAVPNRAIAIAPVTALPPPPPAGGRRGRGGGDPRRSEQWYLDRIGVESAWSVTRGDPRILIAVIDTGVSGHPDLAPSLWQNDDPPGNASPADDGTDQDLNGVIDDWERDDDDDNGYVDDEHGYDMVDAPRIGGPGDAVERDPDVSDDSGHGTAVAGVIGAAAENGIGIVGVAPECRLMVVRAGFNPGLGAFSGVLEEDDAAAAIVYAAENGARVINMSWGDTLESAIVTDAVTYARALGVVLVGSSGNQGTDGVHFPSALPGVIAAGASDFADERASFSNAGPTLGLLAPGTGILTTAGEDDFVELSGTSFAAPLIAGGAGLLLAESSDLPASQVAAALTGTAHDLGFPGFDLATGHGRLDLGRALTVPRTASVEILAPAAGSATDRAAPIVVTAEGLGLEGFTVDVGPGRAPDHFAVLYAAGAEQVLADTVATWDTAGLAAGEYTLRLRAVDAREGMLETRTLVQVDHTPPVISALTVESAWTEDRLTPFVFFATDDLARGTVTLFPAGAGKRGMGEEHTITGAYRTDTHVLRFPADVPAGTYDLVAGALNSAGLVAAPLPVAGGVQVETQRAPTYALAATGRTLPEGELAPRARDLNGDGSEDLVFMVETPGQVFGPLAIAGDSLGLLVERIRLPFELLPRDTGDTDGDGRMEILASGRATAVLIESAAPDAYPSLPVWEDRSGFGVGIASLAAGPVILGVNADSLLVWWGTGDASVWRRSAYRNFAAPGQSIAPSFFAGDIDGDGAVEIVVSDAAGHLLAFREASATLVPAYAGDLAAPAAALVAGGDLDADGRPEVIASVPLELDAASEALLDRRRHRLVVLGADPSAGFALLGRVTVAGVEPRGNCLRTGNLDQDPALEVVFAAAPDLYVFDYVPDPGRPPGASGAGATLVPIDYEAGIRSGTMALSDLDQDGRVEVLAATGAELRELEARDGSLPGPPPPAGLRARILAGGAIDVAWNAGAKRFRLYRASGSTVSCAPADLLAEVTNPAFRDTATAGLPLVTYRVSALEAGIEGECSLPLRVERSAAPVVLALGAIDLTRIRIAFSTPMGPSANELAHYVLLDPEGERVPPSSVISAEGERTRLLVLARPLAPGTHELRLSEMTSAAGVPLAGSAAIRFEVGPDLAPLPSLYLARAEVGMAGAGGDEVRAFLSAAPDSATGSNPVHYALAGGFAIAGAEVMGTEIRLRMAPETPLRPGVFELRLLPSLIGARGERVVVGEGDRFEVVVGGELVAYPNPYDGGRAASDGVTFAGLDPGDEILLLDPLGREVLRLEAGDRGTAFLSVRDQPDLASGVYLYRVAGAAGTRFGKLAIRR